MHGLMDGFSDFTQAVIPICISGMNFWLQDTEQQQNQSMVSNT